MKSVLKIATESYPGAHFATFPRKLVEPCIKAGTSEKGVCPQCGSPWVREVEQPSSANMDRDGRNGAYTKQSGKNERGAVATWSGQEFNQWRAENPIKTIGWSPSCSHDLPPIPATCLDPFAGSGTVGVVAQALGRNFVGLDLSAEYLKLATQRINRPHQRVPRPGKPEHHPLFDGAP